MADKPKAKLRATLPEVRARHERINRGLGAKLSSDPLVGPGQQTYTTPQETSSSYENGQPKYSPSAD